MIKNGEGKLILESTRPIKCSSCGSEKFVYGDHASIQIQIREDGQVEYGEESFAGKVEYVKCNVCGKALPKYLCKKIKW